ncbi:amino acid permease-domain-containing protein [Gautieria morchelliformis]|nr:amino acid permease-domain-containing protein [Gautieria morchelliformis]
MEGKQYDSSDIEKSVDAGVDTGSTGGKEGEGLQRQLKNRHAQMISIGGVIGTGLFLGTASSLASGGPGGLLLGYLIVSSVCVGVMLSLGELVTFLPVAGGQMTLSGRFVDPALSFAMGWNYAELSAAAVLINYWNTSINNSAWITICLVVVVGINFLGTKRSERLSFASIKVITIVGLILLGLIIDLGGARTTIAHHPGAFVQFAGISGSEGRFLGFFSVLIQAAYAFLGTEILGMTAAEMKNPTKNIPRAIKGVYVRILVFYIVASAWSAGSSDLYTSSRAMYGLASTGQAPKIFARTNSRGTPWVSVTLSTALGLLAYMGVSSGSSKVFGWFSNMSAVTGMLNWMGICITLIRFRAGIKAQGLGLEILPYKSVLQPWTIIIILFADWSVFLKGNWDHASFITNYLPVPGFIIMYFGYKYVKGTKIIRAEDMDFVTFVNHDR